MRAPPGVQILSISCSFWENLAKSYVGAPPGELAPPPRGNPRSATAGGGKYSAIFYGLTISAIEINWWGSKIASVIYSTSIIYWWYILLGRQMTSFYKISASKILRNKQLVNLMEWRCIFLSLQYSISLFWLQSFQNISWLISKILNSASSTCYVQSDSQI